MTTDREPLTAEAQELRDWLLSRARFVEGGAFDRETLERLHRVEAAARAVRPPDEADEARLASWFEWAKYVSPTDAPGWHHWWAKTFLADPPVRAVRPPDEGLDVRRVKQAVTNIAQRHGVVKDPPPPNWSLMTLYGYSTTPAKMDAEIAAEYAALAASPSEDAP